MVINHSKDAAEEIKIQNAADAAALQRLAPGQPNFLLQVLDARELEDRNAGVGLARKLGMDACILSLSERGSNPLLVCLDADCRVSPLYITRLQEISQIPDAEVLTIGFWHPADEDQDPELLSGIRNYELFLEYYRLGLAQAGYPFFQHTVGSSMACRALPYVRSGGMNQRKAGEDFYFLHKLFPHYHSVDLPESLVFPSARISERVPFGTGRFQQSWKKEKKKELITYHPDVFEGLRLLLQGLEKSLKDPVYDAHLHDFMHWHPEAGPYANQENIPAILEQIRKASPGIPARRKALYRWMDGLRVLKFVHYFRTFFPDTEVGEALCRLLPEARLSPAPEDRVQMVRGFLADKLRRNRSF